MEDVSDMMDGDLSSMRVSFDSMGDSQTDCGTGKSLWHPCSYSNLDEMIGITANKIVEGAMELQNA